MSRPFLELQSLQAVVPLFTRLPMLLPHAGIDGWAHLIDGSLDALINRDETGAPLELQSLWTKTKIDGTMKTTNLTCQNWTSANCTDAGNYGFIDRADDYWTG